MTEWIDEWCMAVLIDEWCMAEWIVTACKMSKRMYE